MEGEGFRGEGMGGYEQVGAFRDLDTEVLTQFQLDEEYKNL